MPKHTKRQRRDVKRRAKKEHDRQRASKRAKRNAAPLPTFVARELSAWEKEWKGAMATHAEVDLNTFLHWTEPPPGSKYGPCETVGCVRPDCLDADLEAFSVFGSTYNGPFVMLMYTDESGHHIRINGSERYAPEGEPNESAIIRSFGEYGLMGLAQGLDGFELHGMWTADQVGGPWHNPGTGIEIRRKTFVPNEDGGFTALEYDGTAAAYELVEDGDVRGVYPTFRRAANAGLLNPPGGQ